MVQLAKLCLGTLLVVVYIQLRSSNQGECLTLVALLDLGTYQIVGWLAWAKAQGQSPNVQD